MGDRLVDDLRRARRLLEAGEVEQVAAVLDELVALVQEGDAHRPGSSNGDRGERSAPAAPCPAQVEVRLLGGLSVLVDGEAADVPVGAASTTVALLALRRAVHVEELTEVLWPAVAPEVSRRRLRNVLTRIRHGAGPLLDRHGDRIELAPGVVVDHHELELRAQRALAAPPGDGRTAELAALLEAHVGPLLPEAAYEEWTQDARAQAEERAEAIAAALAEARARAVDGVVDAAGPGDPTGGA